MASLRLLRLMRRPVRSGLYAAILAGVAEYLMTDGVSEWVPLAAGLVGAIVSPVMIYIEKETLRVLRLAKQALEWKHAAIALAGIVVIQFVVSQRESVYRAGEWLEARRPSVDHLLTRPLCASGDCHNFGFLVRECELQAVQVGGLALTDRYARGNVAGATEHFRGCLSDRGLSWEPCKRGEPECRFLRAFRTTRRGTALPSFTVD